MEDPEQTPRRAPRVSVLSGCDPTAIYVVRCLRAQGRLERLYRVVWEPRPARRSLGQRLSRLRPRKIWRRLQGELLDWHMHRMVRDMSRELFDVDTPPEIEADRVVEARDVNGEAFARAVTDDGPDLLLVNGAPILKERLFSIPRLGTVNCHFGIAPDYRGSFTLFWPLYRRDYDKVGVTLHYLTEGLDAGPILGRGYPPVRPGDTEGVLMARCARLSVDLLADCLDAVAEGRVDGAPQSEATGSVYRKKDRTGAQDAALWIRRRLGLERVPPRPARRVPSLR